MSSVATALRVLEAVSESQPVGVSELARRLGIPKSSAQRALVALERSGWIRATRGEERRSADWSLTPKALVVGGRVGGEERLPAAARPQMEALHAKTRETIHLLVPDGDQMVLVEHLESPQPVRSSYPLGARIPMTRSSSGKAYLAARAAAAPSRLRRELAEAREQGYATNRGELSAQISAVAAPVRNARGEPVAAISISVPSQRMDDERRADLGAEVREAARQVSAALGCEQR